MADWVHCNTCYKQPFEIKSQFQLTNCGHIFCENCIKKAPGYCQICKQKCSSILLTNKMKPDVEKFFTSPKDMLKQIMQVLDFQDGHRQRLVKYKMNMNSSKKNPADNEAASQGFRELQREYQRMGEENNHLKKALAAMKSQQSDVQSQSRNSTHQSVMQSPLRKAPGSQMAHDSRFMNQTPSSQQQITMAGHTPGTVLSQNKTRTPSERISIRTPPVGGVITTPSPCKMYKPHSAGGYPRLQQSRQSIEGTHRPRVQISPASSQIRSRSTTPTNSLSRPMTPNRYISPRDINNFTNASQKFQNTDATPMSTPGSKTPYTSRPESSSPMQINSSLDPSQRQIRLTYQPRTALASKYPSRPSQQAP